METSPVKVLLVDDDRTFYLVVCGLLLQSSRSYQVEWAETYQGGLAAIARGDHDVCLVDYRLKGHTGIELIRYAHEHGNHAPMIMLTGHSNHDIDLEAMTAGAVDYLVKGKLDPQVLERAIRYAMERKRSEDALRRSEEHFRLLIENAQDIIAILDAEGNIRYQSPSIELLLGYTVEEMIGRNVFGLIHPADLQMVLSLFSDGLGRPGETRTAIYRFRHSDGSWRYLESIGKNLLDHPLVEGVVVNSRDVTGRKHAEDAIRESEATYRRMVETAQEGIWVIDAAGETTFVNARMGEMLGYTVEEMIGTSILDYTDDAGRATARGNIERRRSGIAEQHDFRFIRKDGSDLWVLISTNPIVDREGEYAGALAMITDITERKKSENAIREAHDRLEHRVRERTAEIVEMMAQIEEAHAAQKRFVADASHDIRTPLTVIRGELDLLVRRQQRGQLRDSLLRVIEESKRLEHLANDLLILATLDADRAIESRGMVRLDEFLVQCVSKLTPLAREKSTLWSINIGEPVEVRCDAKALERAISNVLENAIKYSTAGSVVQVGMDTTDREATITVTNSGPGIPAADLPKVFDRFYRSDRTRTTPGTGLGLAIVKSVVEAHSGSVSISSIEASETTVTIQLPL